MQKLTVVTVAYNCVETLEETILSVAEQAYPNLEYIVLDGGSRDGTIELIKKYEKKISFWKSEKDRGIFDAMNKSLEFVTGEYVLFLNAGDRFSGPDVLRNAFEKHANEAILFGDVYIQNSLGYLLKRVNPIYAIRGASRMDFVFHGQGICHQALFTKTDLIRKVQFDLRYPLGADYLATAKCYEEGGRTLRYLGFPVAIFDDRTGGASHSKTLQILLERAEMFACRKGFVFWIKALRVKWNQDVKDFLAAKVGPLSRRYRSRKYVKTIEP